jgi:hypothetical protein
MNKDEDKGRDNDKYKDRDKDKGKDKDRSKDELRQGQRQDKVNVKQDTPRGDEVAIAIGKPWGEGRGRQ